MSDDFCYFENRECKYYPCHKNAEHINCMFCFCPLYTSAHCPGNPSYIHRNGQKIKKCTDCTFPHLKENYTKVISLLKPQPESDHISDSYVHGGESGKGSKKIRIDFSVNVNPLGMPAKVKAALKKSFKAASSYPQRKSTALKNILAAKKNVNPQSIIIGNGASDLITLTARWLQMHRKTTVLVLSPTFCGYERALLGCGLFVRYYNLKKENNFALTRDFLSSITDDVDAVFLCNPNNPTSSLLNGELVKDIIASCKSKGIVVLFDECFMDFVSEKKRTSASAYIGEYKNLIVLNAFTKIYAMAGVRLGYALCSNPNMIREMEFLQSEWSVSSVAQQTGIVALRQEKHVKKSIRLMERERQFLEQNLDILKIKTYPSAANFILLETKEDVYEKLLQRGILVRDCSDFKNLGKNFIRIAIQTRRKNRILISALREVLEEDDGK